MVSHDLAVVGAGIVGLAHALAAARRGLRVVVLDRDAQPNGASIRNFGLVVVSGQSPGAARRLAERSREVWLELAEAAGIRLEHRGLLVTAQRREALDLIQAFEASRSGEGCLLLTPDEVVMRQPALQADRVLGGLFSPNELRVESRDAIPRIVAFLEERHGVEFRWGTSVNHIAAPVVETSRGPLRAARIVVCPGDDLSGLYPERIARYDVQRCRLQMLRLRAPGLHMDAALMSDLSLLRYGGYAALPQAAQLQARLAADCPEALANGVHLIVVQSADGSLVVGDSHHYAPTPHPFSSEHVDRLILDEFAALFGPGRAEVEARWTGTYASAGTANFRDTPEADVRLVMITSGTGASTAFAIGEETIEELFGT